MNEQMEMAFMRQGGLQDDGMKKDPVSGNEVPSGSMAKEVRDDISAQLSEGEYVVPADVVRYFGVKHFEDLRNKAKGGLHKMEEDGRIGGEPVPVGGPKADLRPDEMQEIQKMFEGGMVAGAANGGDFSFYNPSGSTVEEAVTTPGPAGRPAYSGEFSFEQPGAGLPTTPPAASAPQALEQQVAILYGPNGEIVNLMLPRDQGKYDQLVNQGYGTSAPQIVQQQDNTTSKRVLEEVKTSESGNRWMDKYDYNNTDKLLSDSLETLEPTQGLGKIFEMGAMGQIMKASNAAQVAANLKVLQAKGVSEAELQPLKDKLDGYTKDNFLMNLLPANWFDGSALYKDLQGVYGEDFQKQVVKQQGKYSPTATSEAKGFTENILNMDEQQAFDDAVDKGDSALVNHFVSVNRLRNKKDAYAEVLETQGEVAANTYAQSANMSTYDVEDAKTYGGSQQTAIKQGRAEPGGFLQNAKLVSKVEPSPEPKPVPKPEPLPTPVTKPEPIPAPRDSGSKKENFHDSLVKKARQNKAANTAAAKAVEEQQRKGRTESISQKISRGGGFNKGGLASRPKK